MPRSPHAVGTTVFMIRCGETVNAQRADRAVRPYNSADVPLDKSARVRIIKVGYHSERL